LSAWVILGHQGFHEKYRIPFPPNLFRHPVDGLNPRGRKIKRYKKLVLDPVPQPGAQLKIQQDIGK
jgi:hypothetical protein